MKATEECEAWELVKPSESNHIGCRWVYIVKRETKMVKLPHAKLDLWLRIIGKLKMKYIPSLK